MAMAAGSFNRPAVFPDPPNSSRRLPSLSNFWIWSVAFFVMYTLSDASTAMPVGTSGTPAPGYSPHSTSAAPPLENRWMRPLPVSATYTLPLGATEIDSAPERTPLPYVPSSAPRLSYSLIAFPTVTQTLSEPSIATPVAPATAHDD